MKSDYLTWLSRAARWYLPPAEAAEVLEDYQEIAKGRSEEALRRDVGRPKDAVRRLLPIQAYQRWLAVFGILAACVLLPAVLPVWDRLTWWNTVFLVDQLANVFLLAGIGLSFFWFQRSGRREGALPKGIFLALTVPLAGMVWTWFLAVTALYRLGALARFIEAHPTYAAVFHWSLLLGGLLMGLTGFCGLVRARMWDRRWRAVYVLGLAGTLMSLSVWALLSSMSLDFSAAGWQAPLLLRYGFLTAAGLLGTAVSLC